MKAIHTTCHIHLSHRCTKGGTHNSFSWFSFREHKFEPSKGTKRAIYVSLDSIQISPYPTFLINTHSSVSLPILLLLLHGGPTYSRSLARRLSLIVPSRAVEHVLRLLDRRGVSDSMDFLSIGTRLFGHKSSSFSTPGATTTQRADIEPGLKALTAPSNLNHSCINRTNLVPSSSSNSPSFLMDARIVDKKNNREFPPPIPLLARTGNLPCRMPWVLKRCYVDGRLVLHEVPVKHHEFFKADRSNGRLVLRIMYMADKDSGQNAVDQDVVPSTSSLNDEAHVEENGAKEDVIPPMPSQNDEKYVEESDDGNSDAEAENQCHQEKGMGMKQKAELEVPPMLVPQQEQPQHKAMQRVWTESRIYSSSMPCSPKDGISDFFRIGTPTIRPIYS